MLSECAQCIFLTNRRNTMTAQTPFDNKKLQIMTKTLPGGSFPPNIKADMYKDNPQLFVLTGNKKGEGPTYVRAGLEHKTAGLLCQAIETMADAIIGEYKAGKTETSTADNTIISIDCKSGKEKETVAKVVVGRLKDNKMFISVISTVDNAVPVIQFIFQPDLFHPVTVTGSEKLSNCLSAMAAKEWAVRTRYYWYMYSINNPNTEVPTYQGGNSNNNNNNNNNNYNNTAAASGGGDGGGDLPWES